MSTQKSQLTYPATGFVTKQAQQPSTTDQVKSAWASFSKRFWSYTEETSKSDTSSFDGIL